MLQIIVETYKVPILFGLVGVFLSVLALVSSGNQSALEDKENVTIVSDNLQNQFMYVVDIQGAVQNPGVYEIKPGERISHAIQTAGGISENADSVWVSKYINQAQVVTDGMKLYIPFINEMETPSESKTGNETQMLININTASQSELESLTGIGEKRALDIIANRPYTSTDELVNKKVVSQSLYDTIKEFISIY